MANYRAIAAVCEAVLALLQSNQPSDLHGQLQFKVYTIEDFAKPINAGVSLFLYRVFPDGTHRTPTGRVRPDGKRYRTQLPLDLHFLLTAWGKSASLQHTIAGWMMRTLEDNPILPAGLLNAVLPDVFRPDETVELGLAELRTEDLLHIWETLVQNVYQLSIPYIARNIRVESEVLSTEGQPMQIRTFREMVPASNSS